jgi:DNA polymerase-3 subunit gamma/tau
MELPEEELGILKKQAERFQFDQLNHLFSLLLKGEEEVAQSTFPRTMLEMTLIRMATLRPILPIDEILRKLELLEKIRPSKGSIEHVEPSSLRGTISLNNSERGREREETRQREDLEKKELPMGVAVDTEYPCSEETMDAEDSQKEEEGRGESQKVSEETWKGLVDFTRARNPVLGSFLALGNLVHLSDEKIEIGFEKDSFHYERILEKENRSQLEAICHEYLQRKAKVVISALDQGVRSKGRVVLGAEGMVRNGLRKGLEKAAEENPLIQETLRIFNGRIVEG